MKAIQTVRVNGKAVKNLHSLKPVTRKNARQLTQIAYLEAASSSSWVITDDQIILCENGRVWKFSLDDITALPHRVDWGSPLQGRVDCTALTADGRLLAFYSPETRHVHLYDLLNEEEIAIFEWPHSVNSVRLLTFSPDSRFLAICGIQTNPSIYLWKLDTREKLLELDQCDRATFNRLSTKMAMVDSDGAINIIDLMSGQVEFSLPQPNHEIIQLAFSPDNQALAFTLGHKHETYELLTDEDREKLVRVVDLESAHTVCLDGRCKSSAFAVAFTPNEQLLIASRGDFWLPHNPIQVWSTDGYEEVTALRNYPLVGPANPATTIVINRRSTVISFNSGYLSQIELWSVV